MGMVLVGRTLELLEAIRDKGARFGGRSLRAGISPFLKLTFV